MAKPSRFPPVLSWLLSASLLLSSAPLPAQLREQPRVAGEIQAWADVNRNGLLEEREIGELVAAATSLLQNPHDVRTPLDGLFDMNRDGVVGPDELMRARTLFFRAQLVGLEQRNPEAARLVDVLDDGRVDEEEAQLALDLLFIEPGAREPRKVQSPMDGRIDANRDGRIDLAEIEGFRVTLIRSVILHPFPLDRLLGVSGPEARPAQARWGFLEELADINRDGRVDQVELEAREIGMRGPHPVSTEFDKKLDANRNNRVEVAEIDVALRTAESEGKNAAQAAGQPSAESAAVAAQKPSVEAKPTAAATAAVPPVAAATSGGAGTTAATAAPKAAVAVELKSVTFDDVFPVFRTYYDEHPIGKAVLKNTGTVALESISVKLIVKEYMAEKKLCKGPDRLEPGAEQSVDLYALFTRELLKITEETKAQASVSVEYTAAGQAGSAESVQTIRFQNRNAMTWDDDRRAAAFVTKNADPVRQFVGSTVVAAALTSTSPLDRNLLVAIAIHEALAQYGITYWTDPAASYETVTASKTAVDQLRFPEETLRFKTGDCDDLSILTCALLEAAAVETAFITIPGHIYAAFALKMTAEEARKGFLKPDELVFKGTKAWVPVEITNIRGGFLRAWEDGAKEWREYDSRGQAVLYPLADAWKLYAPTDYSAGALTLAMPTDAVIAKAYTDEVRKFIDQETATRVAGLQADVTKNPGKPAYQNKLGVLYARYGLNVEAEQQFAAATKASEYAPALLNLGNLAFLKSDTRKALDFYERARKADAANPRATLGVARSNHALENYGTAKEAYDALKGIDAALAAQFSYLALRGSEATRAADAGQVKGTVLWDEP